MFETKGEKSRRALLVEAVDAAEPEMVLSYESLAKLFDVDSRADVQAAVNQAKRSVEVNTSKSLVAVKNVGYRIIRPDEHVGLAVLHQRKSRRQVKRAKSKVDHVDLSALTPDQRAAVIAAGVALAAQQDFERRADIKYAKREEMEAYMQASSSRQDRSESELGEMKARMKRLEEKLGAA